LGISNAASTLVGQNLGAGNPDRAERSVWITGKVTMLLMAFVGFILVVWADSFIALFTNDTAIITYGKTGLRIVSYGFVAYGLGMVMVNAINGAGDTRTPLWINLISFWMIEIPLAWLLSHLAGWAQNGVFIAILTAESIMTLITLFIFRKGRWKLKYV
ncbi:MAG TPA: MATE family efflux transporter, partial [Bacteroidales bacterium]|nr:MATE family efflux transporter [Bacteroidales bacterium]